MCRDEACLCKQAQSAAEESEERTWMELGGSTEGPKTEEEVTSGLSPNKSIPRFQEPVLKISPLQKVFKVPTSVTVRLRDSPQQ